MTDERLAETAEELAGKVRRWLETLRTEATILDRIDYRTKEYDDQLRVVVSLAKPEYA